MDSHRVAVSARVAAPAPRVYGILADYREGHPRILPPRYFRNLVVERGGVGAGTVIRFEMPVLGATRSARAEVTEPEPGRVLVETDVDRGVVTTFTVEPREDGRAAEVTIATELPARGGLLGALERRLTSGFLRGVYARELALLAEHAAGAAGPAGAP
jgi:hypothetical protein